MFGSINKKYSTVCIIAIAGRESTADNRKLKVRGRARRGRHCGGGGKLFCPCARGGSLAILSGGEIRLPFEKDNLHLSILIQRKVELKNHADSTADNQQ